MFARHGLNSIVRRSGRKEKRLAVDFGRQGAAESRRVGGARKPVIDGALRKPVQNSG